VRVYEQFLVDVREDLRTALLAKLGGRPLVFASAAEADAAVRTLLEETLAPFVRAAMHEVVELQKLVDSEREYARLDLEQAKCSLAEPAPQR
jgi:signal transduction histidine kinase